LSTVNTITINVGAINQPPAFSKGPDIQVLDDAGPKAIPAWAKAISAGPPNDSGQAVHFSVKNDNMALFAAQPAVDGTGKLTFEPAVGASGVANVIVMAVDDGGTAGGGIDTSQPQTFTIGVSLSMPLYNRAIAADVTHDGNVVAEDVIDVINFINASGSGPVAKAKPDDPRPALYYDVTGDNYIAPDDVIAIINYINARPSAEHESENRETTEMTETDDVLLTLLATDTASQSKRRRL
jgi:hypothetical protein